VHGIRKIVRGARIRGALVAGGPLLSQIVSSLGNFALVLLCARFLDRTQFGRFSLAYGIVLFLSQLLRAAVAESAMISKDRSRVTDDDVAQTVMSAGVAASLLFGAVCGVGSFVGGVAPTFSLAVGFAAGAVPLTDITRYVYFLVRPKISVKIDVAWAVLGVVAALALRATGTLSATSMLGAWGASALVASFAPVIRQQPSKLIASFRGSLSGPGAKRLVVDTALLTGSSLVLLAVLAARGGSAQVGEFRAAAIPFSWIQIAHAGGYLTVARRRNNSSLVTRRTTSLAIGVGVIACVLTALVIRLLPESLGKALFGKGWVAVLSLAVVVAMQYATFVVAETLMSAMKIAFGAKHVVRIRIAFAFTVLPLVAIVARFPTARTAVLCLSATSLVTVGAAMFVLRRRAPRVDPNVGDPARESRG
jgi:hypothetical protein